jgi:hypothetical protein
MLLCLPLGALLRLVALQVPVRAIDFTGAHISEEGDFYILQRPCALVMNSSKLQAVFGQEAPSPAHAHCFIPRASPRSHSLVRTNLRIFLKQGPASTPISSAPLLLILMFAPDTALNITPTGSDLESGTAALAKTTPSRFKEFIDAAIQRYEEDTKRKLSDVSFFDELSNCDSVGAVAAILDTQKTTFKAFRAHGETVRAVLTPVARLLQLFLDAGAEGAAVRHFFVVCCSLLIAEQNVVPGGKAVFVAFGVLLQVRPMFFIFYYVRLIAACIGGEWRKAGLRCSWEPTFRAQEVSHSTQHPSRFEFRSYRRTEGHICADPCAASRHIRHIHQVSRHERGLACLSGGKVCASSWK